MAINDGGQAFPMHERDDALLGMSLRDYFAAQTLGESRGGVLEALTGGGVLEALTGNYHVSAAEEAERIARAAYLIADAMLQARAAQP